jgi:hypothetical protein
MITPIFTDRAGHAIGFMPFGQALMELGMDWENWEDPIHHDDVFFPIEEMLIADLFGDEKCLDDCASGDCGEDTLINLIDADIPISEVLYDREHGEETIYFASDRIACIEVWQNPSFRPADAVHPIHNGNSRWRKVKRWPEVITKVRKCRK